MALVLSIRFAKGEAGSLPVCYIPDMADALNNSGYSFACLLQAFITQPTELASLAGIKPSDVPSLVKWTNQGGRSITFVADQCNAVGKPVAADATLEELTKGMSMNSRFIFAASRPRSMCSTRRRTKILP